MKWDEPGRARTNPLAIRNAILALMQGPHTYRELAEACGLHHRTVRALVTPFRKAPRLVHIAAWDEDARGYATVPAFEWGDKPDKKRSPLSNAERQSRLRAKRRAQRLNQIMAGRPQPGEKDGN
jgi:hypothetical protein